MPKLKTKSEIEKLKTTVNLKNLELESVNDELREAQKTIASAERKITDLELTVTILERKLETERLQVRRMLFDFFLFSGYGRLFSSCF